MGTRKAAITAAVVLATACATAPPRASAQDDQFLMPEQSAAKAKEILAEAIQALGGDAYLNVRDVTCTGRLGQFDHSGELTGFGHFIDYEKPPLKERQENLPKRNIISVYNGDQGWELDRGGVSDAPRADMEDFKEGAKRDIDNILRHRIHEAGMTLRYGGSDIVDLRPAKWVELVDSDNRTIRIAFADNTHLPIREVAETRNPKTQMKSEEIDYFANYHPQGDIQTALQLTRERNGIKLFQAFFDKCDYNTNLSDELFTKESLDQRWAQVGKKEREKEAKQKKKDEKEDEKPGKSSSSSSSSE
ncbi:MAG TPA: hypothetical protein VI216_11195 [Candidatus Acidoferrales bacterium]